MGSPGGLVRPWDAGPRPQVPECVTQGWKGRRLSSSPVRRWTVLGEHRSERLPTADRAEGVFVNTGMQMPEDGGTSPSPQSPPRPAAQVGRRQWLDLSGKVSPQAPVHPLFSVSLFSTHSVSGTILRAGTSVLNKHGVCPGGDGHEGKTVLSLSCAPSLLACMDFRAAGATRAVV